jgi:hypothetical protein
MIVVKLKREKKENKGNNYFSGWVRLGIWRVVLAMHGGRGMLYCVQR